MGVVYRKEMIGHRYHLLTYLLIAGFVLFVGVYTTALNLSNGLSNFEYTLNSAQMILLIFIPVLTMGILANERGQKTDQLLYGGVIGMEKIILGKFFAAFTVYLVPVVLFLFYPLLLSAYGKVHFVSAYCGISALALLGGALIAVGMFVSSLTENQSVAAIVTFCLLLLFHMAPTLVGYVSSSPLTSLVGYLFVLAAACYAMNLISRSPLLPLAAFCLAGVAAVLVFMAAPSLLRGSFKKFLEFFALFSPFESYAHGMLRLKSIIYYLSITFLFLFFSVQSMLSGRNPDSMRKIITSIAAILVVALCNWLAGLIPERYSVIDISANRLYTLSDQTEAVLANVNEDVTLYLLTKGGDSNRTIGELLGRYRSAGGRISLTNVDLLAEPRFLSRYTDAELTSNSVIAESAKRFKIIPYEEIFRYDRSEYQTTGQFSLSFDGERKITAAIDFVVTDDLPSLHIVGGHGEKRLPDEFSRMIAADNIRAVSLNLRMEATIPADADCVLLFSPMSDLTAQEAKILLSYLENGGKMLLITSVSPADSPNLDNLMGSYGVRRINEYIMEMDPGYYVGNGSRLLPNMADHPATAPLLSRRQRVLTPNSHGIIAVDSPRYLLDRTVLLSSSSSAVTDRTDIQGPFAIGVAITEQNRGSVTNIIWLGSEKLLEEEINTMVSGANYNLVLNALAWLCKRETHMSIRPRGFNSDRLTLSVGQVYANSALLIVVLPMIILAIGVFAHIFRRRSH